MTPTVIKRINKHKLPKLSSAHWHLASARTTGQSILPSFAEVGIVSLGYEKITSLANISILAKRLVWTQLRQQKKSNSAKAA